MNKIINSPDNMVEEMLEGYLALYGNLYQRVPNTVGLMNRQRKDQVSVVVGGGAGNEPWIMGYVGKGLATGAALGHVYAAPPARSVLRVSEAVPHDKGVLFLSTNHAGDVLNFELVGELGLLEEGLQSSCIFVTDDITSAPSDQKEERRGVAGIALVLKIAGAACDFGHDLADVCRLTQKANDNTYTFSVTTSPGYMPGTGKAMFTLPESTIAYGMGFNGEPGVLQTPLTTADEIAETICHYLLEDIRPSKEDQFAVMINGYGFTSVLELSILSRKVEEILSASLTIHNIFMDTVFCPQGSGGCSISLMKLDNELKPYYDHPVFAPLFNQSAYGGANHV